MTMKKTAVGHAVALFTIIVWGITFVCTKVLLVDFSPVEILFLRFVMAFCVLYALSPGKLPGMTARRRLIVAGPASVSTIFWKTSPSAIRLRPTWRSSLPLRRSLPHWWPESSSGAGKDSDSALRSAFLWP